MSSHLARLQAWYAAQCDGDWEHEYGVEIRTLDNPGWGVSIQLAGTYLEGVPFTPVDDRAPDRRWLVCRVRDDRFEGFGGPLMLEAILDAFFAWSGLDARQAAVILRDGGPPDEVARALVAITLGGEDRRWVQDQCVHLASYPDANVRRVVAVCLGHLARIHGALDLDEIEPVLRQLEADPDLSVVGAVADTRDDLARFLARSAGTDQRAAG